MASARAPQSLPAAMLTSFQSLRVLNVIQLRLKRGQHAQVSEDHLKAVVTIKKSTIFSKLPTGISAIGLQGSLAQPAWAFLSQPVVGSLFAKLIS